MIRRLYYRIQGFFRRLIGDGGAWGLIRLALAGITVLIVASVDRWLWLEPGTQPAPLYTPYGWRYLVPPIAALAAGLLAVANYLVRLHELPRSRAGVRYLLGSAFGLGVPHLDVKDGKLVLDELECHSLRQIGGPGYLNIHPGSAVVLETLARPSTTLGEGVHFVNRLQRIRDVISLADQHYETASVTAASKDGIQVNVKRIQYRYRLMTGHRPRDYTRRTTRDPYPFSEQAAHDWAYRRSVRRDGLSPWESMVRFAVEGVITDYINVNWFDQVTTPLLDQNDPRRQMIVNMNASALRTRLRAHGTDLLWFDIGNFEPVRPEVFDQRVENWSTTWAGVASLELAVGEAERLAANEQGRAEAQAEMLTSILKAMGSVNYGPPSGEQMLNLFLLRTAQLLETMVESSTVAARRDRPEQPDSVGLSRMLNSDSGQTILDVRIKDKD